MALILYAAVYTALGTTGLVVLRRSLEDAPVAELVRDPAFYVGGLFYATSFLMFLGALRRFEALTVFPLFSGLMYAAVTVAAAVVLDESLTPARLTGIVLIGVGAVLLVR